MTIQRKLVEEQLTQQELESWLWKAADILRGAVKPERYGSCILPLLFFKRLSDVYQDEYKEALQKYRSEKVAKESFVHKLADIPKGCLWDDIRKETKDVGGKLNDVLGEIARANPDLDGVINRADFNKPEEIPADRLVRLIEHFSQKNLGNKRVPADVLGNAYEYLLKQFNELAPARAGEFYTPREVVKVMVEILDPSEGAEIYDPCAGTGGMLIVSHYHLLSKKKEPKKLFLYGQEINAETCAIARMNVILHGLEAEIRQGDTLADPKFLEGNSLRKFDFVLANPMWNQDGYRELMENDRLERFSYGIAPASSADWGWIQHMLASLKPEGRMGVVLDQGALFRGGAEGKIRQKVVEHDLVECVVALPEKIFYNTGAPGCLIFLNKNKPHEKRGTVLFVYAAKDFEKLKNMNRLRDEDIKRIADATKEFRDQAGYATVHSLDKIMENDFNLSVTRYVDVFEQDEEIDVSQTWQELRILEEDNSQVDDRLTGYMKELGYERKEV
jgi:type I restriction enzyme M protein